MTGYASAKKVLLRGTILFSKWCMLIPPDSVVSSRARLCRDQMPPTGRPWATCLGMVQPLARQFG